MKEGDEERGVGGYRDVVSKPALSYVLSKGGWEEEEEVCVRNEERKERKEESKKAGQEKMRNEREFGRGRRRKRETNRFRLEVF